ncbi:MAG: hypothetical protein WCP53_12835, partial [Verrucomicrobiota bacterium]
LDPFDAEVIASAKANGIAPVHFWMMALVGFELGYLTPPVALNLLLLLVLAVLVTRQRQRHRVLIGDEGVFIFGKFTDGIRHVVEPVFFPIEDVEAACLGPLAHDGDRLQCGSASGPVMVV